MGATLLSNCLTSLTPAHWLESHSSVTVAAPLASTVLVGREKHPTILVTNHVTSNPPSFFSNAKIVNCSFELADQLPQLSGRGTAERH